MPWPGRVAILCGLTIVAGLLAGSAIGGISAFFYPVFVLPLLGAFAVAAGLSQGIHWCRISNVVDGCDGRSGWFCCADGDGR